MFIGHLPAGYVFSRVFADRLAQAAAMVGSILPDVDLLYFYTLGDRAVVHHHYWTHVPAFWVVLGVIIWSILRLVGSRYHLYVVPLLLGVFLHLCLDTIVGSIFWMYPFSDMTLTLIHVPALYDPWYLNFIWHWTFALEIAVVLCAGYVFVSNHLRKTVSSSRR
ncbi:MAG: metal-dependent hydrolase [Candidatus Phaeomarinobacter sp.]